MSVHHHAFCKDRVTGVFGLAVAYSNGMLSVIFDEGRKLCKPEQLVFI
jgi:hypothetical protein